MTSDQLRDRLVSVLDGAVHTGVDLPCPRCHGTGRVDRTVKGITQADVAEAIGTQRTSVVRFLQGRQTFGMDVTLRLIDWLDRAEQGPRVTPPATDLEETE